MFNKSSSLISAMEIVDNNQLSAHISSSLLNQILRESSSPINTAILLTILNKANILTNENVGVISNNLSKIYHLRCIISFLEQAGLFSNETASVLFPKLTRHSNLHGIYLVSCAFQDKVSKRGLPLPSIFNSVQLDLILDDQYAIKLEAIAQLIKESKLEPLFSGPLANNFFMALIKYRDPGSIASAASLIWECGLYTPMYLQNLMDHRQPLALATALKTLKPTGLLFSVCSEFYRKFISQARDPIAMSRTLVELYELGILSSPIAIEWVEALNNNALTQFHIDDGFFNEIFNQRINWIKALYQRMPSLFTDNASIINKMLTHPDLESTKKGFNLLHTRGLLNGKFGMANLNTAISSPSPQAVSMILVGLRSNGLLSGMSAKRQRELLLKQPDTSSLVSLEQMFVGDLVVEPDANPQLVLQTKRENFYFLCRHHNLQGIVLLLRPFRFVNQQRIIDAIKDCPSILRVTVLAFWNQLPQCAYNSDSFMHMIEIERGNLLYPEEGARLIQRYLHHVINQGIHPNQLAHDPLSTHTTSVHQSVSESAIKLLSRYSSVIDNQARYNRQFSDCVQWIHQNRTILNDSDYANVARRFISDKENNVAFHYSDPESKISVKTMLILFWLVIHDEEHRIAPIENSKKCFIEALYEMQRGYNIAGTEEEQKQTQDLRIFPSSMFNKLVEKMVGLSDCVSVNYTTARVASYKFIGLIKSQIVNIIKSEESLSPALISALRGTIMTEFIEPMAWEVIESEVRREMSSEFHLIENQLSEIYSQVLDLRVAFTSEEAEVLCKILDKVSQQAEQYDDSALSSPASMKC